MIDEVLELYKDSFTSELIDADNTAISDFRLDSSFFINNTNIPIDDNLKFEPLSNIATVFFPGIILSYSLQ